MKLFSVCIASILISQYCNAAPQRLEGNNHINTIYILIMKMNYFNPGHLCLPAPPAPSLSRVRRWWSGQSCRRRDSRTPSRTSRWTHSWCSLVRDAALTATLLTRDPLTVSVSVPQSVSSFCVRLLLSSHSLTS